VPGGICQADMLSSIILVVIYLPLYSLVYMSSRQKMIVIKLNEALRKRNRSLFWLSSVSGVSYPSLWKISKREVQKSINLEVLSKIISALNCEITDILHYVEDEEDKVIKQLVKTKDKKSK
jgi:DNA-binding Xre family transcriptional regulator